MNNRFFLLGHRLAVRENDVNVLWSSDSGACSMFRRELYRTMARVLDALDPNILARTSFRVARASR